MKQPDASPRLDQVADPHLPGTELLSGFDAMYLSAQGCVHQSLLADLEAATGLALR